MPAGRRRAAGVQVNHQPLSTNLRVAAVERDGADQRDDPDVEIVDAVVTTRGFRRAAHLHAAIGVAPQYLKTLPRFVARGHHLTPRLEAPKAQPRLPHYRKKGRFHPVLAPSD